MLEARGDLVRLVVKVDKVVLVVKVDMVVLAVKDEMVGLAVRGETVGLVPEIDTLASKIFPTDASRYNLDSISRNQALDGSFKDLP